MKILIKNGRIIDPKNNIDEKLDIIIQNSKIYKIGKDLKENVDEIIDVEGMWVTPGFIDLHTHLREPGFEYKETIKTGSKSAVAGGFTTICCMPNTKPIIDNKILVEYIKMKAEKEAVCNILPIGSVTIGQEGKKLSEIGKMAKSGACAISEDGTTVLDAGIMKTALKYSKMFNLPMFSHCEDISLAGGSMNAGDTAVNLGLKGISNSSEEVIVARDIILANEVCADLHICHISTKGSVELVRWNKQKGYKNVTAEVTPHHFTLIDEDIKEYDANFKMNPPLRSREDREAILEALKDDTIEVIATDHAPHHIDEKNCEFERAMNGIVGLETALALSITELVNKNILSPFKLIEKLTKNPAKIIRREDIGHIGVGANADITIIDPNFKYKIDKNKFFSMGKNTSFDKKEVFGKILYTIVNGKVVFEDGNFRKEFDF